MKCFSPHRLRRPLRWTVLTALAIALVCGFSPPAKQAQAKNQNPSPSALTAIWWQWAFSIPKSDSPLLDDSGANAATAQPYNDLFFLVGAGTTSTVTRTIEVPHGTAFFYPVFNTEWDNVSTTVHLGGTPHKAYSIPQLRAIAAEFPDGVQLDTVFNELSDGITTIDVPYTRLQSPPFVYQLPPAGQNLYAPADISGAVAPAVSDGYWSYIDPLPPGTYTLHFGGDQNIPAEFGGGVFTLDITYHITVTP